MKFISWNVNGLRAALKKGFADFVKDADPDFLCLQETKMRQGQAETELPYPYEYWNSADKAGYSGVAVFTNHEPLNVTYGIGADVHDHEGRVLTLEYEDFFLVNCYTPNSQRELARLSYRMDWEDAFLAYLCSLDKRKPVILCGDLNVAHEEIDIRNPKQNRKNAGFTDDERARMTRLLSSGFADTYRTLNPDKTGAYTWWSYMGNARANNTGWRIDYFIVSQALMDKVTGAGILPEVYGSDHCPVSLTVWG